MSLIKPLYNLVLLHTPGRQDIGDFLAIRNMMVGKAPDIKVSVISTNQQISADVISELAKHPTLFFSPMPIGLPPQLHGKLVCPPPPLTKMEEYRRLAESGLPTPRTRLIENVDELEHVGDEPTVVIKPNRGLRGRGVNLIKTSILKLWTKEEFDRSSSNNRGMLAQQYIEMGGQPTSYRVMTVLGDVIYCIKSTANNAIDHLPLALTRVGMPIASNAGDRVIVEAYDPDVIDLGRKIHQKLSFSPVLGIDMVRDLKTGDLYVLELNSGGWTWHLSSDHGKEHQRKYSLNLYDQFDALKTITNRLIAEAYSQAI